MVFLLCTKHHDALKVGTPDEKGSLIGDSKIAKIIAGIIADIVEIGLILTMTLFTAHEFFIRVSDKYVNYIFGWSQQDLCAILGALLILAVVMNRHGKVCYFLFGNRFMAFLGEISLEIYLIHYYLLGYFPIEATRKFVIITLLSIVASYLFHKYIGDKIYQLARKK